MTISLAVAIATIVIICLHVSGWTGFKLYNLYTKKKQNTQQAQEQKRKQDLINTLQVLKSAGAVDSNKAEKIIQDLGNCQKVVL